MRFLPWHLQGIRRKFFTISTRFRSKQVTAQRSGAFEHSEIFVNVKEDEAGNESASASCSHYTRSRRGQARRISDLPPEFRRDGARPKVSSVGSRGGVLIAPEY